VHYEEVTIEEEDKVPTYLENYGFNRIGEDLVHIYDTPGIKDKDPSPWVIWAFALFFAMILSDGGYGVIFLGLAMYLRYKFPKIKGVGKRMLTLLTLLSGTCIAWGIFSHSFFGISFDPSGPVASASGMQWLIEKKAAYHMAQGDDVYELWTQKFPQLANLSSPHDFVVQGVEERDGKMRYLMRDRFYDNIMLELALLVGVIHIALSFLRSFKEHWAGIGWIAFMVGSYLYFPIYLKATSLIHFLGGIPKIAGGEVGLELLGGGVGVAVILSLIQHRAGGAAEIINIIQVFADVLSYLRLYALGLAGGMMSSTFNDIGGSMTLVTGAIVIIIGHVVNIVLSVMGGVIHGLRLNFLEWYHYCFEGGGKLFNPLRMLKIKD